MQTSIRPSEQSTQLHEYGDNFYRFLASFAVRSAEQIIPVLNALLPINSVVDFGCGQGAWLSVWRKAGAKVTGVDGPYVDQQHLMIDADEFRGADLSRTIDLGRRFDVVQSLEVAEHLPSSRASEFIGTLTSHGPLVMFSAAVPGQGGEHHINEQPLEYWRKSFASTDTLRLITCARKSSQISRFSIGTATTLSYTQRKLISQLCRIRCVRSEFPRTRGYLIIGRCPTASIMQ